MSQLRATHLLMLLALVFGVCTQITEAQVAPRTGKALISALKAEISQNEAILADLNKRVGESQQKWNELNRQRNDLLEKQDRNGISAESYPSIMRNLQSQRIELVIELAGLDARRNAMKEMQETMIVDRAKTVVEPLQKLLEFERESLSRAEGKGTAAQRNALEAKRRILGVEVKIAEAQMALSQSNQFAPDLLSASLERAEKKARLEKIESILASLANSRSDLQSGNQIELQIEGQTQRVVLLRSRLADAESKLKSLQTELDIVVQRMESDK